MADNEEKRLIQAGRIRLPQGEFFLETDIDGIEAYVTFDPIADVVSADVVSAALQEMNLSEGLIDGAVESIVEGADGGKRVDKVLVAQGTGVVEGRDAYIDFIKHPTGTLKRQAADMDKVDYKEIMGFENVHEGDHIATYMPMVEGQGGTDVFGRIIPARNVKDLKVDIGDNVRFEPESDKYFATHYGHVTYKKRKIEVSPLYQVPNDVDLSQGNIRFVGRVEVGRDVIDDFCVEAEEGIFIGGTAEACRLVSGKEIVIKGGVTGKGKGSIECKEELRTRFLNEVTVNCGGDVIVENEIVNSTIYTMGRLIVRNGAIVGSQVVALKGIITRDAGSELGVKTSLIAGLDYHMLEKLLNLDRDMVKMEEKQQALLNRVGPMLDKALKSPAVSNNVREQINEFMSTIRRQQKQLLRLNKENGDLRKDFIEDAIECATVTGKMYPSVSVVVGKFERQSETTVTGPVSFSPEPGENRILITNDILVEKLWGEKFDDGDTPELDDVEPTKPMTEGDMEVEGEVSDG